MAVLALAIFLVGSILPVTAMCLYKNLERLKILFFVLQSLKKKEAAKQLKGRLVKQGGLNQISKRVELLEVNDLSFKGAETPCKRTIE